MPGESVQIVLWEQLQDRVPLGVQVATVDLVVLRLDDDVHLLFGRCTHRNASLADARVEGNKLVCRRHGWDYNCRTGRSMIDDEEALQPFKVWRDGDAVWADASAVKAWRAQTPMDFYDDELDL